MKKNNLVKQRKIGAILRFLKLKIFLFFDFKKIIFYFLLFLLVSSKWSIKIRKKLMIIGQKDRKLDREQFGQTKKNWCNSEVSQNKDFLIF